MSKDLLLLLLWKGLLRECVQALRIRMEIELRV
jgi:hypothetical protein